MTRQYSRRTLLTTTACVVGAAAALSLMGRGRVVQETAILSGAIMGTSYRVTLPRLATGVSGDMIGRELRAVLERVDATLSTYRTDSEVSRFNRAAPTEWVPISTNTSTVVAAAMEMARLTEGAFDPTVGPLVDLWGFGPAGPSARVPDAAAVAAKRRQIGYAALEGRQDPPALRKRREGLRIDFSGIAEGFAVDEMAHALDRIAVSDFLLELGGEVRCRGSNPAGRPWTIAIQTPSLAAAPPRGHVALTSAAIATSGDYRKFFIVDGRRYSHVIDPRTGRPVDHGLASVTVIGGSAMQSDALSTAIFVMGPEAGFAFAERHQITALFISRSETGFSERMTASFARYLGERPT
ncbi:FAD:protein FMN transferase [Rhizobium aegyptiacum]|uniref:FAD:protein FMN transferase n=1 Tax=Rhizobium aegyptiacum TaxID=1764550 RepID=UPI0009EE214A|nr:FAD:protein FMN transferase [Rhizobium aegyptiacum]